MAIRILLKHHSISSSLISNFFYWISHTVIKVLPDYQNVPVSRCLIQGMSRNVTKCIEMKLCNLWNARNYCKIVTKCSCLTHKMFHNGNNGMLQFRHLHFVTFFYISFIRHLHFSTFW